MKKSLVLVLAASAATLCAGTAHAANVSWSIGINTPIVGTVISNGPVYPAYPVAYAPAPIYAPVPFYVPQPVYAPVPVYPARPVFYPGRAVYRGAYYRPVPVVYPRYYPGWRGQDRWEDRHEGHGGRHD